MMNKKKCSLLVVFCCDKDKADKTGYTGAKAQFWSEVDHNLLKVSLETPK